MEETKRYQVLLDGIALDLVKTADSDLGTVLVPEFTHEGTFARDASGCLKYRELHGRVNIRRCRFTKAELDAGW